MRINKLSTIYYGKNLFQLSELTSKGYMCFWAAVKHFPETYETKEHFHIYFESDKKLSPSEWKILFTNNTVTIHPSKFDEWFLYSSHNKDYLTSKSLSRSYEYNLTMFDSSDRLDFEERVYNVTVPKTAKLASVYRLIKNGYTPQDLLRDGVISPNVYLQIKAIYTDFLNK